MMFCGDIPSPPLSASAGAVVGLGSGDKVLLFAFLILLLTGLCVNSEQWIRQMESSYSDTGADSAEIVQISCLEIA